MRIYVAGASSEIERAEQRMAALRAVSIEVTSTWPEVIRKVGAPNPMGATRDERMLWSMADLDQVSEADVFWFLLPEGKPTAGAYTEFGYALMLGGMARAARAAGVIGAPEFWILVSGTETSIFTALADHYATDSEALDAIQRRRAFAEKQKGPEVVLGAQLDLPSSDGG